MRQKICTGHLLKKIISKHNFTQFANNFELAFRKHFSHSNHDYCDNEKLTQEIQNHLIAVKGSQKYLLSTSQKGYLCGSSGIS